MKRVKVCGGRQPERELAAHAALTPGCCRLPALQSVRGSHHCSAVASHSGSHSAKRHRRAPSSGSASCAGVQGPSSDCTACSTSNMESSSSKAPTQMQAATINNICSDAEDCIDLTAVLWNSSGLCESKRSLTAVAAKSEKRFALTSEAVRPNTRPDGSGEMSGRVDCRGRRMMPLPKPPAPARMLSPSMSCGQGKHQHRRELTAYRARCAIF